MDPGENHGGDFKRLQRKPASERGKEPKEQAQAAHRPTASSTGGNQRRRSNARHLSNGSSRFVTAPRSRVAGSLPGLGCDSGSRRRPDTCHLTRDFKSSTQSMHDDHALHLNNATRLVTMFWRSRDSLPDLPCKSL